ncbi:MAG: Methionine aminopeptidase [Parcubacteria group bacterium GW2011_GWA2_47_10b]|uniref:Methionine aminopeptidase n=1 Tax=Candidatus Ryanbacteria bacterium RIFCSPLOWO2_02_FULL_47_14 TaxID=1802129 RepID=A0A1G2H2V6_9BACT|nr:MAG: Methionine aminopeptidase [Parcubacteria group bacterium GW2011_GWA2_47_10b]OGZ44755.1 MAG: type I methionyl aminopeptidase [Candidatus Ryanbacteria bacterium RIFCSPHIGHO2_01_FULL_48_80]OGZ48304.1 MAG: type I methionyl aminopeptidase [Candidatus Ryanbacteria bacterium RIFCSPHIGHO2_02_FULL_47_25]OGZ56816.1 MAG: type I methionyl aminopeptidase [Candidatus Ryanbacteria bacterium RIFCSPLOWO2_02_FULL_47_14]
MIVRSEKHIESLREGGRKLASILSSVACCLAPEISTIELDTYAFELIKKVGGTPSFKGYRIPGAKQPYPATLCVSVNDEVVHGIPGKRTLRDGDIVGLDIGMKYKGFFTDTAITVGIGRIAPESERLLAVTKKALNIGIAEARAGRRVGDIGAAIQQYVEGERLSVVRELVGHGVGKAVHEEPEVPNWGAHKTGPEIVEGMVLALEPMVTLGSPRVRVSRDGWTWRTIDGSLAAHFEHTILITKEGAEIITLT